MSVTILKMEARHVPAVAALEKVCFPDPWSEKSIAGELENPLSLWLVAEEDGAVRGYIGSQSVCGEADMMNVAVSPDARRQGIAQRLLDALWEQLCAQGIASLTLEVRASNAPAIALYEKNGYVTVGCRKNYYKHPKEDAIIMRKGEQIG